MRARLTTVPGGTGCGAGSYSDGGVIRRRVIILKGREPVSCGDSRERDTGLNLPYWWRGRPGRGSRCRWSVVGGVSRRCRWSMVCPVRGMWVLESNGPQLLVDDVEGLAVLCHGCINLLGLAVEGAVR